jgi:hypothetical protein
MENSGKLMMNPSFLLLRILMDLVRSGSCSKRKTRTPGKPYGADADGYDDAGEDQAAGMGFT